MYNNIEIKNQKKKKTLNKCSVRLRKPFDSGSLRKNRKIAQAKKQKAVTAFAFEIVNI